MAFQKKKENTVGKNQRWQIERKNFVQRDRCVLCGKETQEEAYTNITQRLGYIEGGGQLCSNCYYEVYLEPGRSKIN